MIQIKLYDRSNLFFIKMLIIFFLFLVEGIPGYARHQEVFERKQLFYNNWKFFLGDITDSKSKDFNDESWRSFDLPHDCSIEGSFPAAAINIKSIIE